MPNLQRLETQLGAVNRMLTHLINQSQVEAVAGELITLEPIQPKWELIELDKGTAILNPENKPVRIAVVPVKGKKAGVTMGLSVSCLADTDAIELNSMVIEDEGQSIWLPSPLPESIKLTVSGAATQYKIYAIL